jgi:hypothetical protein
MPKKFPGSSFEAPSDSTENPSSPTLPLMGEPGPEAPKAAFVPPPVFDPLAAETPKLRAAIKAENQKRPSHVLADLPKKTEGGSRSGSWPFWLGAMVTLGWFIGVALLAFDPAGSIFGMPAANVAIGMAGAVAPPALLWMILAYLQRANDIRSITEPLRRQLQMVLGTGSAAENRVRRFNDALEKQLDLLRQAGDSSYDVLQSALQVLQEEEQAIHVLAERSSKDVARVAGVVRDNSAILEDILQDNRERFGDLSSTIAGQIATLDEKASVTAGRLGDMVEKQHALIGEFLLTAEKKLASYTGLSDQIGSQEKESSESARRMAEMLASARAGATELNQLLLKNQQMLEDSSQRVLSRIQEIGQGTATLVAAANEQEQKFASQAQGLGTTLTREIAALDTLTGRLEAQIGAANEGLGKRAAELEEKQTRLAEQANKLMQGLDIAVRQMEQHAGAAFEKFAVASESVQLQGERAARQFQISTEQYDRVSDKLETISQKVANRVATIGTDLDRQSGTIAENAVKAASAADKAQSGVGDMLEKLEVMIARIFDVENKAKGSVQEMNRAYTTSLDQLDTRLEAFGKQAAGHIGSLSNVQDQFDEAGEKLAERARQTEATWQSLVSAAERQQEILQEQLRHKIEEATGLLNENAVAIEAARDSLYASIETAFTHAEGIKNELKEMGAAVDAPFDAAISRVQGAVQQGQFQLAQFVENLGRQAQQVVSINTQLTDQQEKAGHRAAETLAGLDAVAARIEAIQHDNMQSTQEVLLRLSSLASALQTRMTDLSGTAESEQKKLAEAARQFSLEINGLIHDSQTADTRVRLAAALLQEQASDVRQRLEGEAQSIAGTLDELKTRFTGVAEQMQEISRINDTGIQGKVEELSQVVREASARLEGLGSHIGERAEQLSSMQGQLAESGRSLDTTTQAALDRLSVFTHAMVATQTTSAEAAQQVFARLNDMQEQFSRQITAVNAGSQTITSSMRDAVAGLVEQSVALAAASEQAESRVGNLAQVTESLQDRANNARTSIEEQVTAMQTRLGQVLGEIEAASVGLERNATVAFDRSEGMAKRFESLSAVAFSTLSEAARQVSDMSDAATAKVGDVTKALQEQAEKVTFAGVHLAEVEAEVRASAEIHVDRLTQLAAEAGGKALYGAEELRQKVGTLREDAEAMLARFGTLEGSFVQHSAAITGAASELETSLSRMQETCAMLGQEGRATAEKIGGQTMAFRSEVEEALAGMAMSGDALEKRGDFAIAVLHQVAGRFAEATQNLGGQFETEAKNLQDVSDRASAQLEEFGQKLTQHTDRLDATAASLASSGQAIGETLEKANFLLRNLSTQTERVKGGVQEIGGAMLQRLSEMLCTFEDELKNLTGGGHAGLEELERKAEAVGIQLKAQSNEIAKALSADVDVAVSGTTEQLANMQREFRAALAQSAEALVEQLKKVQESGTSVSEVMSTGTTAGAEMALQTLARIRATAEGEVKEMHDAITHSLGQMDSFSNQIREAFASRSGEVKDAAAQIFARVRMGAEEELQTLLHRASGSLKELQSSCESMTHEMRTAISQAEGAGEHLGQISQHIRETGQQAANDVHEAGAGLASAQEMLQRSQGVLFEVAQKSGEALALFNENLVAQTRQIASFQDNLASATQDVDSADAKLETLGKGFERVLADISQRLNDGLLGLSQQLMTVREEARGTVGTIAESAQGLGQQNQNMASTANILAKALSQLEAVSRSLSDSMIENTNEVEGRVQTLEEQAARLRRAGDTASLAVDALGTRLQNQLAHVDRAAEVLRQPLVRTETYAQQPQNQSYARSTPMAPRPLSSVPTPPRAAPAPAPRQDEATQKMAQRLQSGAESRVASSAPRNSGDNELVASLTQIIQQLEGSGGGAGEPSAQKKAGK